MEEKKQKKIKASGTPANLAGYMMRVIVYQVIFAAAAAAFLLLMEEKKAPAGAGKFGRVPLSLSFTQQTPQHLNKQTPQRNSRLTMRWLKRRWK